MRLLETEVLCSKVKNEALGIEDNPAFLKFIIDLDHVIAVKQNGFDDEDEHHDRAVLYTNADYFVVNITFEEAVNKWTGKHCKG